MVKVWAVAAGTAGVCVCVGGVALILAVQLSALMTCHESKDKGSGCEVGSGCRRVDCECGQLPRRWLSCCQLPLVACSEGGGMCVCPILSCEPCGGLRCLEQYCYNRLIVAVTVVLAAVGMLHKQMRRSQRGGRRPVTVTRWWCGVHNLHTAANPARQAQSVTHAL